MIQKLRLVRCLAPCLGLVVGGALLFAPLPLAAEPGKEPPKAEKPRLLEKLPQTAEEKAKVLNDLYAHLATAEDEEGAKKVAATIERIWAQSGSDTVSVLMQRAEKSLSQKNPELALKFLDFVVELAPDYAEGFHRRAYVHFTENNFQGAVGDLRRVIALEPNHYKAMEHLAHIWRETGNKKGAYRVLKQLLDIHPFAHGIKQAVEELGREVDGQGI